MNQKIGCTREYKKKCILGQPITAGTNEKKNTKQYEKCVLQNAWQRDLTCFNKTSFHSAENYNKLFSVCLTCLLGEKIQIFHETLFIIKLHDNNYTELSKCASSLLE